MADDQQILWDLFDHLAQAATVLGDTAAHQHAVAVRDRLAGPRIGSWGQLLEWLDELKDPVLDTPADTHRHVSHLYALFPGRPLSPTRPPAPAAAAEEDLAVIKSPMVGTFYAAPAPDAENFTAFPTAVKVGDVACIVEAMTLMHQIESDVAGTIRKVLVENGQTVQYDQPLFMVEPA